MKLQILGFSAEMWRLCPPTLNVGSQVPLVPPPPYISAPDRYLEGVSSNPARVNTFQLTSAVSDYREKFLFKNQFYFSVFK